MLDLLVSLKEGLPYLLRYETSRGRSWKKGHEDFDNVTVTMPVSGLPANELLRLISIALPRLASYGVPKPRDLIQGEA